MVSSCEPYLRIDTPRIRNEMPVKVRTHLSKVSLLPPALMSSLSIKLKSKSQKTDKTVYGLTLGEANDVEDEQDDVGDDEEHLREASCVFTDLVSVELQVLLTGLVLHDDGLRLWRH